MWKIHVQRNRGHNGNIHVFESHRREVDNESCKQSLVIRMMGGRKKVSIKMIQFIRDRKY